MLVTRPLELTDELVLYLPISPYISLYLPISPYISLYLPISPDISHGLGHSAALLQYFVERAVEGLGSGLRLVSGYLTLNPNPDQVRLYFIEGQAAAAMGRHQKDSNPNPTPNPKPKPNPKP